MNYLNLLHLLKGYNTVIIDKGDLKNCISMLYKAKIYHVTHKCKGNYTYLKCDYNTYNTIVDLFTANNISILETKKHGFPAIYAKYKNRPGVFIGIILFVFVLLVSQMFVWQINITGIDRVSREDAEKLLREHGIYVGAFSPSLDLKNIYNQILIDNKDFCWISVNIRGTVANVEVRESEFPEKLTPSPNKHANIIAEYDGEITLVEAYEGQSIVKYGDYVKKGELLVSGIYENKMGITVAKYAYGKVYAKINKEFYIEIPLKYEEKVYNGEHEHDLLVKIFSKSINILNNSGKMETGYDIIEENEDICLFNFVTLPISYNFTTYKGFEYQAMERSEQQARRIAHERLNKEIASFAGDGAVLSKETSEEISGGIFKLKISTTINKDIAVIQEFNYYEG